MYGLEDLDTGDVDTQSGSDTSTVNASESDTDDFITSSSDDFDAETEDGVKRRKKMPKHDSVKKQFECTPTQFFRGNPIPLCVAYLNYLRILLWFPN